MIKRNSAINLAIWTVAVLVSVGWLLYGFFWVLGRLAASDLSHWAVRHMNPFAWTALEVVIAASPLLAIYASARFFGKRQ